MKLLKIGIVLLSLSCVALYGQDDDSKQKREVRSGRPRGAERAPRAERGEAAPGERQRAPRAERTEGAPGERQRIPRADRGEAAPGQGQRAPRTERTEAAPGQGQRAPRAERGEAAPGERQRAPRAERGEAAPVNPPYSPRSDRPQTAPGNRPDSQRADRPDNAQRNRQYSPGADRPNTRPGGRDSFPRADRRSPQVTRHSNGRLESYRGANNSVARFRPDGSVRIVRTREMTITRSPSGVRRVVRERPDHTVIVTRGAGHGYVQRSFTVRNQVFVQRTHYVNRAAYVRVYRPYTHGRLTLHIYTPVRYYSPAFYGWAYSPWRRPVYYGWGWRSDPWYAYYGGYFAPYPSYSSPAFWLTDYVLSRILEEAYRERMAAAAEARASAESPYNGQVALTPDVKQAIADEVQRQLALERAEGQAGSQDSAQANGLPPTLSGDGPKVFVVSDSLDVNDRGGGQCVISEGDVLQAKGALPPDGERADVQVLASKGQDCRKGSIVSVPVQELVEMQNRMRETLDQGLENLQTRQGKDGLPELPAPARSAPVQASFASALPAADPNVAAELSEQEREARDAEQNVIREAADSERSSSSGTVTISSGQTIEQVVATLGAPRQIFDLGAKKVYVYSDTKITFNDGRVSDVQ